MISNQTPTQNKKDCRTSFWTRKNHQCPRPCCRNKTRSNSSKWTAWPRKSDTNCFRDKELLWGDSTSNSTRGSSNNSKKKKGKRGRIWGRHLSKEHWAKTTALWNKKQWWKFRWNLNLIKSKGFFKSIKQPNKTSNRKLRASRESVKRSKAKFKRANKN